MRATVIDMRAVRVRELKRRVADGSYVVDAEAVAAAMVELFRRRARSRAADPPHPPS